MQLLGSHITLRMRLECTIKRRGQDKPQPPVEVLNEMVIDRGANPYLTKIECWERDSLITKVEFGARTCGCRVLSLRPPPICALHSLTKPQPPPPNLAPLAPLAHCSSKSTSPWYGQVGCIFGWW